MNIYNNKKTFFYKLKSSCKKEWSEYTNHKFLSDLVNNKLPYKNFKNYLVQDYVFLQQFLKILALSVYKSNNFDEIDRSINFIKVFILEKLKLLFFLKIITVITGVNVAKINDQNNNAVDIQIGNVSVGKNPPIKILLSKVSLGNKSNPDISPIITEIKESFSSISPLNIP